MPLISTGRQLGQTLKSATRARQIIGVFAKYGFEDLSQRSRLTRFFVTRFHKFEGKYTTAERLRMAFEELGPTFVKLGQLLSTRPNLIPSSWAEEFKKFHDQVSPFSFADAKRVVEAEFKQPIEKTFTHFDETPLAAASIAQVHKATLASGEDVVVKIQRPGIVEDIEQDLGVLYTLAKLADRYLIEARPYNPQAIVDEFFKTLELETNFLIEANNIRQIAHNFVGHPHIRIPKVYSQYCTEKVLVMERLVGTPLSDAASLRSRTDINEHKIVEIGLRSFFKMVFRDGLFHGDLHAGNIFIMGPEVIGLVDFGVVGRLSQRTKGGIANMLVALATADYELLAYEYLELAPYNDKVGLDQFTRELRDLLAPYHGMTFKEVNFGKLLMESTAVAARHQVVMPSELMLFFKALVTIEGMARTIIEDFDALPYALEFAQDIVKMKYEPERLLKELLRISQDSASLLSMLPRQTKQLMRKLNSNDFAFDVHIREIDELKRSIQVSGNLTYLGFVIAALIIGSAMTLTSPLGPRIDGFPAFSVIGLMLAGVITLLAFYNYIKK